jgi:hypothetical protein
MPQELYNVSWVEEHGLGIAIRSVAEVDAAVALLLRDLELFRPNLERMRNRAVFEVPGILHAIQQRALQDGRARQAGRGAIQERRDSSTSISVLRLSHTRRAAS